MYACMDVGRLVCMHACNLCTYASKLDGLMDGYVDVCNHICRLKHMYMHTHAHIHILIYNSIYIYTYKSIHMYMYTYTY